MGITGGSPPASAVAPNYREPSCRHADNGTGHLHVQLETANQFVRPVVFNDADNDNQLDLDAETTSRPSAWWRGLLDIWTWLPFTEYLENVVIAPKIIDLFTRPAALLLRLRRRLHLPGRPLPRRSGPAAGRSPPSSSTSAAPPGNRDDAALAAGFIGGPFFNAVRPPDNGNNDRVVLGDLMDIDYAAAVAATSTSPRTPRRPSPTSPSVASGTPMSTARPTTSPLTWTRSRSTPTISTFQVYRAPVNGSIVNNRLRAGSASSAEHHDVVQRPQRPAAPRS